MLVSCRPQVLTETTVMDDFSGFDDSTQMYAWSSAPVSEMVRFYIENAVGNVFPGAKVDRVVCAEEPRYLSGAKKQDSDPDHVILVRVGAVFPTGILFTTSDGAKRQVQGVSTMICQNLDAPGNQSVWLEFTPNGDIDELEKLLPVKIYKDNYSEQEDGEGR
jgi:hypothetical protein